MSSPIGPNPVVSRETENRRATQKRFDEAVERFELLLKRNMLQESPEAVNQAVAKIVLPSQLLNFLA